MLGREGNLRRKQLRFYCRLGIAAPLRSCTGERRQVLQPRRVSRRAGRSDDMGFLSTPRTRLLPAVCPPAQESQHQQMLYLQHAHDPSPLCLAEETMVIARHSRHGERWDQAMWCVCVSSCLPGRLKMCLFSLSQYLFTLVSVCFFTSQRERCV